MYQSTIYDLANLTSKKIIIVIFRFTSSCLKNLKIICSFLLTTGINLFLELAIKMVGLPSVSTTGHYSLLKISVYKKP